MKYIKLCSIILLSIILSIAGTFYIPSALNQVCAINKNKALSDKELQKLFPDANFRNTITRNFKHQEITLNKIASLSGELNANNENIEDLTYDILGNAFVGNLFDISNDIDNTSQNLVAYLELEDIKKLSKKHKDNIEEK